MNMSFSHASKNAIPFKIIGGCSWLLLLILFAPVIRWFVTTWSTSIYDAHGALVPLIVGVMLWSRRRNLASEPRQPDFAGLWLLGAAVLLLLLAMLMDFNMLGGVAFIIAVAGMIWTLQGVRWLRAAIFPVSFLLFMLPLNYPLEIFAGFPLRLLSVKLTAALLRLTGLEVTVQGTLLATSNFQVAIESPCSGLKTLSALLMVGLVLSFFLRHRLYERMVLLLLIPVVAVLANAVRNMVITLLGHFYGREYALGFLHSFSGLAVFLLAVALLILFSELLLWRRKPAPS